MACSPRHLSAFMPLVLSAFACSGDGEGAGPDESGAGAGGLPTGVGGNSGDFAGAGGGMASSGGMSGAPSAGGAGSFGSGGTPSAGGASAVGGAPGSGGSDANTLRATITAPNIVAGAEEHVCVVVDLPNEEPIWVEEVRAILTQGSHHLIVDRAPQDSELATEPYLCSPTMGGDSSRLVIAQQRDTTVRLPDGVAFLLEPRQHIFLQLHYFNTAADARDISGTVELDLADTSAGVPKEAKSEFTGSLTISIDPQSATDVTSYHLLDAPTGTRRVFALTSHTHHLGVRSTIERVASVSAPASAPLHESLNWSEPPLTLVDPPLAFQGSDGLRLTCEYENDTDFHVGFGTGFNDEMCFMWYYYYDE